MNERDYGDYTGKNKWEVQKEIGEISFEKLRRSWDHPIPHGETLKQVYGRVVPYFTSHILPLLKTGKNILLVAHGNSLRALMKYIEGVSDEGIENLEMMWGAVIIYTFNTDGKMIDREERTVESYVPA